MALPKSVNPVVCDLCHREVHPLVARYLFLAAGWRGRPAPKPHKTTTAVFCGPCGDAVLERVGPLLPRHVREAVTS